jgi:predicted  nucleic acid-binding Zn-ribbon protein
MAHHCVDCGTKFSNGLCPNCHEDAFILETQSDYLPEVVSDEFLIRAEDQAISAHKQLTK